MNQTVSPGVAIALTILYGVMIGVLAATESELLLPGLIGAAVVVWAWMSISSPNKPEG